ncbi:MAG: hypothetical protein ABWY52_08460 [Candidatus Limnocylindrales bacterium]
MPGDRAEDHASGQPDLMTGILVPAATIAVSGTLIAILLMAQVMGGLAFVPVLRRAIGPAAVGRWRRRRDRAPGA